VLDETRIRLDAIHHVRALRERWVAVPASELKQFTSGGNRIFLRSQQGIFKPAELSEPLSITSTLESPYNDAPIEGTCVLYDFLSEGREFENDGLKKAAQAQQPLIYFLQVTKKPSPEYVVFAPVYVVGWDDARRQFIIDLAEQKRGSTSHPPLTRGQLELPVIRTARSPDEIRELTRSYEITEVQRRLYHARFRNEILNAYRNRCAVCRLRVRSLLDAAHVTEDRDPKPAIAVSEGLALCAIHHRAFDAEILRFDAEYRVRIKLRTSAGEGEETMLLAFEGRELTLPKDERLWPAKSTG
jgi:putative restriction endonuclease